MRNIYVRNIYSLNTISDTEEDKNAFNEPECSSNWSNLQMFLGIQDPSFFQVCNLRKIINFPCSVETICNHCCVKWV